MRKRRDLFLDRPTPALFHLARLRDAQIFLFPIQLLKLSLKPVALHTLLALVRELAALFPEPCFLVLLWNQLHQVRAVRDAVLHHIVCHVDVGIGT